MSSHETYDVIVIGMGAMGSAALYQLARRGRKCLALEQFDIPHERGSSHGITRIIRLAYYEHQAYVPLLKRSFELWRELEAESQMRVLHVTGSVDAGPPGSTVVEGSRSSCETHGLRHDVMTSKELTARFPGYRLPPDTLAVFQPDGGFLLPEACISTYTMLANTHGAEVHAREKVLGWEPTVNGVAVTTDRATYKAARLIVSAGAWISNFVPALRRLAVPERQVLAWLQPTHSDWFLPEVFPVFNLDFEDERYYGLPVFGIPGFKLGKYHHRKQIANPDQVNLECDAEDERVLRDFAQRCFPDGAGPTLSLRACMFTNTPDEHFIIDLLPGCPQVVVASPCSGHGFKFASVVGEILADLADRGSTRHDISWLGMNRFGAIG